MEEMAESVLAATFHCTPVVCKPFSWVQGGWSPVTCPGILIALSKDIIRKQMREWGCLSGYCPYRTAGTCLAF